MIRLDRGGIAALARDCERRGVEIGAEDLDLRPDVAASGLLEQQHGDRIGLLAGGAARDPDADGARRPPCLRRAAGCTSRGQHLERMRIAEEGRHRDQEVREERLRLFGVLAQIGVIVGERFLARDLHAPRRSAAGSVERLYCEKSWPVRTRRCARMRRSASSSLSCFEIEAGVRSARCEQLDELPRRDRATGRTKSATSVGDRAARHRGILGLVRVLHQDDAAGFLDRLDADGAVGAGAGQDDGDEAVAMLLGQRAEEEVDRRAQPARLLEGPRRDRVVGDNQAAVGRDDVNVIVLELRRLPDLGDRHFRACAENAGELAAEFRVEMEDDDEGRIRLLGQRLEKALESFHPPADAPIPTIGGSAPVAICLLLCVAGGGSPPKRTRLSHRSSKEKSGGSGLPHPL